MFRKLVSNLAFSPALVGQLGFYARRLRGEEATRRIGLIFTALALIVQSFAVFSPPESANASNPSDFVSGGVSSVGEYLHYYDANSHNIKDLYTSLGITRSEIKAAKAGTFNSRDVFSWGLTSRFSAAQGEKQYDFVKTGGTEGTVYYRPLTLWDTNTYTKKYGTNYAGFIGHSKKFGWFAIMKACGNLITKVAPPPAPKPATACTDLDVNKITRTKFRFVARASAKNGALIDSYTFTVRNAAGKTLRTPTVKTSAPATSYDYTQNAPGTYRVYLTVATSLGAKSGADCHDSFTVAPPPAVPVAACTELTPRISRRTLVQLDGAATTAGGATISRYSFAIKNSHHQTVATRTVKTTAHTASAPAVNLTKPGAYTATLAVTTSVGVKTSAQNCATSFTIVKPAVCQYTDTLPATSPDCQPCPGDSNLWIKDKRCQANIIQTKTANNLTQNNVDATSVTANASDRISYTLTTQNIGLRSARAALSENLSDVLEYAHIIDNGGGTFNRQDGTLSWPTATLQPGQKQSRVFVVQLDSTIPAMAQGASDRTSYDCRLTNTFGNSVDIEVNCPLPKQVENTVAELPHTGASANVIFSAAVLAIVVYFYARSRQLGTEVRLIRRDLGAGTI